MSKTLTLFAFIVIPYLLAIDCEDDCRVVENVYLEDYVSLVMLTQLQETYDAGDEITLSVNLPASNNYFDEAVNLFEETGQESATLVLLSDNLFTDNELNFITGSQGKHSNWFIMPYNPQTQMYELEINITLNRSGAYSHYNGGEVQIGASDCPDYELNILFEGVEGDFIEFTVGE